jgi:hypothetical protein
MNALRYAVLGLGSLGLLLEMGCTFTQQTHLALQDMSRPSREVRQELLGTSTNAFVVQGHAIGGRELNGQHYSGYQFTNVLAGPPGRVLEILVAQDTNRVCRIGDTSQSAAGKNPVFLLSYYPEGGAEFFHPATYFRDHYPNQDLKDYTARSMWLSLDVPVVVVLLQAAQSTGEPYWQFRPADDKLSWMVRRRGPYILSHLKYVYAIPLDIVTSPYQIFVMLRLAHG